MKNHLKTTKRHLPYEITQLPDSHLPK